MRRHWWQGTRSAIKQIAMAKRAFVVCTLNFDRDVGCGIRIWIRNNCWLPVPAKD